MLMLLVHEPHFEEQASRGPFPAIPCRGVRGFSEPDRTSSLTPQPPLTTFFFLRFIYLFLAVLGLRCCTQAFSSCCNGGCSLAGDAQASHCGGLSWGAQAPGSVAVAHGLSCHMARGIFPKQGLNPCPLHWQGDSQPLDDQGSHLLTTMREFSKPHGPIALPAFPCR